MRSYGTLAAEFAAFAGTRGGLARCDAGTVGAFVATLAGYQAKTVEQKLCALRSFLRFASGEGLAAPAMAGAVPAVPSRKQARIPSVWDPADVARIVEAVDRGSPCGKRDYAIILLVVRLGLRSIDVKRLEFSDFDWPGKPAVRRPGQDRPQGAVAAAERRGLGGHRLRPRRPAGQ